MAPQAQNIEDCYRANIYEKVHHYFYHIYTKIQNKNDHIKQEEEACCNFLKAAYKLKHPNLP